MMCGRATDRGKREKNSKMEPTLSVGYHVQSHDNEDRFAHLHGLIFKPSLLLFLTSVPWEKVAGSLYGQIHKS
jgi:hypothetical protein